MADLVRACVDRILPPDRHVEAAARSIAENPSNTPIPPRHVPPGASFDHPLSLALLTGNMWPKTGKSLRVRFLDGDPDVQARVPPFARAWSVYANITFEFGSDPDAEIRISFQDVGSWSWIGTQCLSIARDQPTMNFGWLARETPEEEYSRVVTHEFGHSIGCIHEHQNPVAGIPWDKSAVYAYYEGPPNNWTKEEVDVNLFQRYAKTITQYSTFDPDSIMEYPIPAEFTDGKLVVGLNRLLSAMDKEFIAGQYPRQPKPDGELHVDGGPAEGSIGVHGEEDTYHFKADKPGTYDIETSGPTDVVMAVFGPDDPAALVASDDDSGLDLNAKITHALEPGTYEVRIRHYSPRGTGTYRISVSMDT